MKTLTKKLGSTWAATLVICLTILVATAATAFAAATINGKNIKKGTITSKQIKNGTITKSDLSKKLSVVGPAGPQGPKGDAGATSVTTRRFTETPVGAGSFADRDVQCLAGEKVVGGGAAWTTIAGSNELNGIISVSAPSTSGGDPVADGGTPTGWTAAGKNGAGTDRTFLVYVICAKP